MASEHELNYHFNAGGAHGRTAIDPLDLFAVSRFADEESIPANFRDLFRFFIDTMNDSAVILSPDGSVLYGNRAFSAMMGRSQHELLGARFAAWVADECQTAFAQLLSGSPSASRSALQLLRSDGLRVPVQLAVNALDGSGYPGFLGIVVFDRTEELFGLALQLERQAAREREQMPCEQSQPDLERLNHRLANANRGMVALCGELRERVRQLERADTMKTRFLSNISHELRSPLHSILATTSLLLGPGEGVSPSEQQKLLGYIRNAADWLFDLVNDLLDLAKIASGKIEIRAGEFAVADLFASLRAMLPPPLLNPAVRLIFDPPAGIPALYSDPAKIAQILRNFIDNGLKFTERGEVRVSAAYNQKQDSVVFAVRDTGVGIAAKDHEKIFEEFTQLDNPARNHIKGSGLGLSICRSLATVLGGRIAVQSELGAGAKFSLSLPRRALAVTAGPGTEDESNKGDGRAACRLG